MRKKSAAQKQLSGTTRPDRETKKASKVVTVNAIPTHKGNLTASGKKIYKELCEHLIKHNVLCKIDALYLSKTAHYFDLHAKISNMIKGPDDMFQYFDNGTRNVSPELTALVKLDGMIEKACANLGLHLLARDKISAFAKEENTSEKVDPIEAMMKKMKGRKTAGK